MKKRILIVVPLFVLATLSSLAAEEIAPVAPEAVVTDHGNPWELNFILGSQMQNNTDFALGYFSTDDWLISTRLGVEVETITDLFVQFIFVYGSQEGELFERWATQFEFYRGELAARYGFALTPWFRPYASLTGMLVWNRASIEGASHKLRVKDGFLEPHLGGRVAMGFEVYLPRSVIRSSSLGGSFLHDFTFGIAVETGYSIQQKFDLGSMKHSTAANEDDDSVTAGSVDLGTLSMNGWFVAADFRLHF